MRSLERTEEAMRSGRGRQVLWGGGDGGREDVRWWEEDL